MLPALATVVVVGVLPVNRGVADELRKKSEGGGFLIKTYMVSYLFRQLGKGGSVFWRADLGFQS